MSHWFNVVRIVNLAPFLFGNICTWAAGIRGSARVICTLCPRYYFHIWADLINCVRLLASGVVHGQKDLFLPWFEKKKKKKKSSEQFPSFCSILATLWKPSFVVPYKRQLLAQKRNAACSQLWFWSFFFFYIFIFMTKKRHKSFYILVFNDLFPQ